MDSEEQTRQNYEDGAEWHIKKSGSYSVEQFVDAFVQNLPGKDVLEIGVGAGRDIAKLLEKGCTVTGLDYAQSFIDHCKKKFPDITYIKADVRTVELHDQSFDGVWAFASLLNMSKEDFKKVLQKLHNALRTNGIILMSLKAGEGERMVDDVAGSRFFSFYQLDELKTIVQQAGFEVIHSDTMTDFDLTHRPSDTVKPGWVFAMGKK